MSQDLERYFRWAQHNGATEAWCKKCYETLGEWSINIVFYLYGSPKNFT